MTKPPPGSEDLPEALIVAPEAPYPPMGGGALRTASLVEYFGRRYRLDCLLFREPGAPDPRGALPDGLVRRADVIELPAHSRSLPARLARNAWRAVRKAPPLNDRFGRFEPEFDRLLGGRRYDVALIEHFWCAPYFEQVAAVSRQVALDLHNIESEFYRTTLEASSTCARFLFRRFYLGCLALERLWLPRFALVLTPSPADAALLSARLPGVSVKVVPNTIPLAALPPAAPGNSIVFSGNLEYHPNLTAIRYFRDRVWPLVKRRAPGLVWRIIGRNPAAIGREIGSGDRIELVGAVSDAIAEIARSRVAVVPVLAGSGTRVKILEAWAAGVAVVSTPRGAEGLPVRHGEHLLLAEGDHDFAEAVLALLGSEHERRRIGAAGRSLYEQEFTWDSAWRVLDGLGFDPRRAVEHK